MADRKQDDFDQELQLQQMQPDASDSEESSAEVGPLERQMDQVVDDLQTLPTAAQLAVLRAFLPELLEALDVNDRAYWARELLGEGAPEIPTLTA